MPYYTVVSNFDPKYKPILIDLKLCNLFVLKEKTQVGTNSYHRFLDEAGDTAFYGKGKVQIIGTDGVSKCFLLGMLKINEPLNPIRDKLINLQHQIEIDPYFRGVPSIEKKKAKPGYYLHATDDIPEVRKLVYDLIKSINCSFEVMVARKILPIYENLHHGKESEFYADLLSHLLKNKLQKYDKLVLNIAERSRCTTNTNLELGLSQALKRFRKNKPNHVPKCNVVFNVQQPTKEPLLNIADYFCWAVQRVFEKGETRYYDYISDQIKVICDLYDQKNYERNLNYYGPQRKLTKENLIK